LITNLLQWIDQREVDAPLAVSAGETLSLKPGQTVAIEPLTAPPKSEPPLQPAAVLEPLRNGYYLLGEGEERRWIAVNTFSAAESDLRQPKGTNPPLAPAVGISLIGRWPIWTWLTLAALGLFTGEWWLFHRRKSE
jgi:hypothetical protein